MFSSKTLLHSIFPSIFSALVLRKIIIALIAMHTVQIHKEEVSYEKMISSDIFHNAIDNLNVKDDIFVLILNKHALNMTYNWLCNTKEMNDVHNRSLIVTLDSESAHFLRLYWPQVSQLNWIVPALSSPFNYGDGFYQLFYLFRSNLAKALVSKGKTFWMIQQDTFWATSLFSIPFDYSPYDIVFDSASDNGPLVAAIFMGSQTLKYKQFPDYVVHKYDFLPFQLSSDISWWYVPDNAYMTSLTQLNKAKIAAGQLPFSLITNWQWMDSPNSTFPPQFIQFDGETNLGGKLAKIRNLGFYFLESDGITCDSTAVKTSILRLEQKRSSPSADSSYSRQQFKFYQGVVDTLYSNPMSAWVLNRFILPYAHFCMLTL